MQDTLTKRKVHIELYRDKNSIVNDAFDRLVAGIYLKKRNEGYSCLAISGCEPGVGTTTIAISLAVSMAVSGWKTVLIDADMKKDMEKKRLNQQTEVGLSEYLEGSSDFNSIVYETNYDTMHYISCGHMTDNPVRLLCSSAFEGFMDKIKETYDFAIFDSPSITATDRKSVV